MIQEMVAVLRQSLTDLTALFDSLIPLMERERAVIKKRQIDALEGINQDIAEHLKKIHQQDQRRREASRRLGVALGLEDKGLNLKKIDQALEADYGLMPMRQTLRDRIEQADRMNRENQAILKGVQVATDALLEALRNGGKPVGETSYDRRGQRQVKDGFHRFSRHL